MVADWGEVDHEKLLLSPGGTADLSPMRQRGDCEMALIQSPVGAAEIAFLSPLRGCVRSLNVSRGSRRGLSSAVPPGLKTSNNPEKLTASPRDERNQVRRG